MHDESILIAIDDALRSPAFCACGQHLVLRTHDDAAWLECRVFDQPSRLPARVVALVREVTHDRRHVHDLPDELAAA